MEKIVLTYGTFDLFHIGHLNLSLSLGRMGEKLIVGLATDEFNAQRGKLTAVPFAERIRIVENIRCVDMAIPMARSDQKAEDIRRHNVSLLGMGSDWEG